MSYFENKIILITGGTGSFGNTILRSLLEKNVGEVRVFSRDEKKQDDMRRLIGDTRVKFYLGDVREIETLLEALKSVDFVFHAAALKQVPSCEFFPIEAIKTNIHGTLNVIKASKINGVKKIVCLSTDKAAYPINSMGMTKALMEKVVIAESRNNINQGPVITITRYGNVMASRGSVIPLFIEQIKKGLKLTITDPSMTRFLMSLDEAVSLVLYSFENGKQGDLFVQKSPASTIGDLALALKNIFNAENEIKIIGSRHGEKLYETLLTKEEFLKAEDLGEYYRVPADNRDLNYNKFLEDGELYLNNEVEYNSHNTHRLDEIEIANKLLALDYIKEQLES